MENPTLLAVDTATEACSCALLMDNQVYARSEFAPRRHAELILPMVDALLTEAGITTARLDGLAFGRGPGSFTGVRIACGVIQGMAFGLDLPVAPVSCLAALAQGAYRETGAQRVLAAIDARMNEVYWGAYTLDSHGLMDLRGEETVSPWEAVSLPPGDGWQGYGSGWDAPLEKFAKRLAGYQGAVYPQAQDILPLARAMFQRGETVTAAEALPVYLRDQVVRR